MTHSCARCGAIHAQAGPCPFCSGGHSRDEKDSAAANAAPATEGNLALAVDWRSEVSGKLEAYRHRRRKLCRESVQSDLPFEKAVPHREPARVTPFHLRDAAPVDRPNPVSPAASAPRAASHDARRSRGSVDRMEIDLAQPPFDFEPARDRHVADTSAVLASAPAPLSVRRRAGLVDSASLLCAYGCFLAVFFVLGGHWSISRMGFAVVLGTAVLLYALYFGLFVLFGGATPGMLFSGLRVENYDGSRPDVSSLSRRYFGYLVSGGTLLLGFMWALLDDEHLSWHDRISHTCLREANPLESE